MLRKETNSVTKYLVNGIGCNREDIYRTIVGNKFFNGTVNIDKFLAGFSLDTKKFTKKFDPTSEEFKTLVEKMIQVVDIFYEARMDYDAHSKNLRQAIRDCVVFVLDKSIDTKVPYNDIMKESTTELMIFLHAMQIFGMSQLNKMNDLFDLSVDLKLPGLSFDTSSIKPKWDESGSNKHKSQYLKKSLSLMSERADVICGDWLNHNLFADESSKKFIQSNFDEFKKTLKSLQDKLAEHDLSLPHDKSISSRISSIFHFKPHGKTVATDHTPSVNSGPK